MAKRMKVERELSAVIALFKQARAGQRCSDVGSALKGFGFVITEGKAPGHKVFVHPGLVAAGFTTSSYNCGHGKDDHVKPRYIDDVRKLLEFYKEAIVDFMTEKR